MLDKYLALLHSLSQYAPAILAALGGLYVILTAVASALNGLLAVLPQLKGGKLAHVADFLEAFAVDVGKAKEFGSKLLGSQVPPGAPPASSSATKVPVALFVALAASLCFWSGTARAADISMGLSVPALRVRLADPSTGKPAVDMLAAGAGYQVTVGWFPTTILGRSWDLLSVGGSVFGQVAPSYSSGALAGQICTLQGLACIGFGSDLLADYGNGLTGLLTARVSRVNLFTLLSLNLNLDLSDPIHPATGLLKGNHLAALQQPLSGPGSVGQPKP